MLEPSQDQSGHGKMNHSNSLLLFLSFGLRQLRTGGRDRLKRERKSRAGN